MSKIIPAVFTDEESALVRMLHTAEEFATEAHIDVADGLFVQKHSVSVANLVELKVRIPVEVHLMVKRPLDVVHQLAKTPARKIIVHWETLAEVDTAFRLLRRHGFSVGLALNPETALDAISPWLTEVDQVLVMGVTPGVRGDPLLTAIPNKVRELRTMWPNGTISTDGGLNTKTISSVARAGADRLVVATAIWQSVDPRNEYLTLQRIASQSFNQG